MDELAADLADRWDTRVKIQMGRGHGKLIVEFASAEDLDRIVGLMRR
jgi:ParB family chromosome partitioning protein